MKRIDLISAEPTACTVRAALTARTDHTAIQDEMETMAAMGLMVLMAASEDQEEMALLAHRVKTQEVPYSS